MHAHEVASKARKVPSMHSDGDVAHLLHFSPAHPPLQEHPHTFSSNTPPLPHACLCCAVHFKFLLEEEILDPSPPCPPPCETNIPLIQRPRPLLSPPPRRRPPPPLPPPSLTPSGTKVPFLHLGLMLPQNSPTYLDEQTQLLCTQKLLPWGHFRWPPFMHALK